MKSTRLPIAVQDLCGGCKRLRGMRPIYVRMMTIAFWSTCLCGRQWKPLSTMFTAAFMLNCYANASNGSKNLAECISHYGGCRRGMCQVLTRAKNAWPTSRLMVQHSSPLHSKQFFHRTKIFRAALTGPPSNPARQCNDDGREICLGCRTTLYWSQVKKRGNQLLAKTENRQLERTSG